MPTTSCPFCEPEPHSIAHKGQNWLALRDNYPVSPGHTLIVPKLHVPTLWGLPDWQRSELMWIIEYVRDELMIKYGACGFNIGINEGEVAGQTVPHVHVHIIPRYPGGRSTGEALLGR